MHSEFDLINYIKARHNLNAIGDDCAVLPMNSKSDLLITADMLVENIDFRLEWAKAEDIGHKSLAVSLSDIAAMGGTPTFAMISLAIPESVWKTDFIERFYEGWHALAGSFEVELVGGDISKTEGPIVIDSTVMGSCGKGTAILRSTARPGDGIYVSGDLGGAAGGLKLLEAGKRDDDLCQKQLRPQPHLILGNILRIQQLADAMIDLSDGISSDLTHICRASRVGAKLYAERLPINKGLTTYFDGATALELALNGGEDFELLFTGNNDKIAKASIDGVIRIGEITTNAGVIEWVTTGGVKMLKPQGFVHF
ncbi:MAG: thiamine-phosphate kinase [Acidobacteria bacterium]|nr:thiamine-phosphate kinase [Acidobacteriota bacterium]